MKKQVAFAVVAAMCAAVAPSAVVSSEAEVGGGSGTAGREIRIHSHNDYAQKSPFWGAYEADADSIEADVFLVDGELLVAHSRKGLKKENTLRRLYLEPLRDVMRKNGGRVRANGKPLQLVIDLKSGKPALDALLTMIDREGFRECFDIMKNPSAVMLSVGGDISGIKDFLSYPDFVFFSVPSSRKLDDGQYKRVSWISDCARIHTKWRSGAMAESDREKILAAAARAHAKGVPYRLWGFPDHAEAWQLSMELGLDYINTDRPAAVAAFLSSRAKVSRKPSSRNEASYGRLLRKACADPWLFRHEGKFYLTQTGSSKVLVEEAKTLSGLSSPECTKHLAYDAKVDPMLATLGYEGANGVWSPEIHHFSDDDFPGHAGWYMFTALRDSAPGDSRHVKSVVLKSLSGKPEGPYGNPVTGEKFSSHLVLDRNGVPYPGWLVGQTVLRIREGEWKGVYSLFVSETGRGTADFHQEIRIARLKTPWQMTSDTGIVTVPTQPWESIGSGPITDPVKRLKTPYYPRVVEGATAVYGDRGEVYLIYSGSGFWTNYGLGQLTWTGDDPLRTSSWVKYAGNPVFGVADGKGRHLRGVDKQGAGHASFFVDEAGTRHMVYHAYPYNASGSEKKVDGITLAPRQKAKFRNAYVAPYVIDYTKSNGVSTGVFRVP